MGRWEVGGGRLEISMLYFEHGCCSACSPSAYMSTTKGVPHGTLLLFFFGSSNFIVKCASNIKQAIQHRSCTLGIVDVAACSPNAYMSTNKGVPHGTLLLFFLVPQILL